MSERFYIKLRGSEYDRQGVTDSGSIGFGTLTGFCNDGEAFYKLSTNRWLYLSGENAIESDYNWHWEMVGNIVEFKTYLLDILYGVE